MKSSVETAEKKLLVEMNLKCIKMIKLGSIAENTGISGQINRFYLGYHVTNCDISNDDDLYKKYKININKENEDISINKNMIKFVNLKEIEDMINKGEIIDSFTITCLQLAKIQCPDLF